jgi:hypothetical protein
MFISENWSSLQGLYEKWFSVIQPLNFRLITYPVTRKRHKGKEGN